ncbi:MAG: hypothetical protein HY898_08145 [Deltaproteobacteria bacterium]|nr:hypothetical protein [Deltaproteobacteria bacterium]
MPRVLAPGEDLWHFACGTRATPWSSVGKDLVDFARKLGRDARDQVAREGVARTLAKLAAVAVVDSLLIEDPSTSLADVMFRDDGRSQPQEPTPWELAGCVVGLTPRRLVVIGVGSRTGPQARAEVAPLWVVSFLPHQIGPETVHVRRRKLGPLEGQTLVLGDKKDSVEFVFEWPEDIAQMKAIADRLDAAMEAR